MRRLSNSGCCICSTKTCAHADCSPAEEYTKTIFFWFLYLSTIVSRASLRQQPQANTIGHSAAWPKGRLQNSQQQTYIISHYLKSVVHTSSCQTKEKGDIGGKGKWHETMHTVTLSLQAWSGFKIPCWDIHWCCTSFVSTSKTKQVTKRTSMQKNMSCSTWSNNVISDLDCTIEQSKPT